jgi:purine catabolism regulator
MTTQFVGRFTEEVVQLADHLALPLIEIPSDVPFTALTNPVMKAIVDNQNKRLRFSEEMNKKFIDLEINGGGFQQIADVLGALLEKCVLVTDASFYVLAMSAGALPEEWLHTDAHGRCKLLREGWRNDGEDRYRAGDYFITCKEVIVRKRLRGYVLSAADARQDDEYKNIALNHAATSIALEFSKLKSMEDEWQLLNNNLFLDLMLKNVASEEEASARANGLNWPRMPLTLAVLDLVRFEKSVRGKSESEIQELKEAVASIVHDVLRDASFPAVLAVTSDLFNCPLPWDCDPGEVRRILNTAMERIETECGFMSSTAVSQKIGCLIDMPAAQRECRDAMRIDKQASSQSVVFIRFCRLIYDFQDQRLQPLGHLSKIKNKHKLL